MWVISKSRLRQFWQRLGLENSQGPLSAWYKHVEFASWSNWHDVKADFSSADLVGNCTVFNIGGNKYRLITRILFESHKVFILRVMTHQEYGEGKWQVVCGCHRAPPAQKSMAAKKQRPPRKSN